MQFCKKTVFSLGTHNLLWRFFFLLIFYIFFIRIFFPKIRNIAPAKSTSFKFMMIRVNATPVPMVRLGDLHEITSSVELTSQMMGSSL